MLALVASIHVLTTAPSNEDMDGRDKPDHDGSQAVQPSQAAFFAPKVGSSSPLA